MLPYFTHILGHLPFLLKDSYQSVKLPSSAFLELADSSLYPYLPCSLLYPEQYGKEACMGGSKTWRDRRLRVCHTRPFSESSLRVNGTHRLLHQFHQNELILFNERSDFPVNWHPETNQSATSVSLYFTEQLIGLMQHK